MRRTIANLRAFTPTTDSTAKEKNAASVDYIDVVAWDKLAETTNTYLKKGTLVLVEGRLAIRSYESKGGEKHKAAEVVLSLLQMLGLTSGGGPNDAEPQNSSPQAL